MSETGQDRPEAPPPAVAPSGPVMRYVYLGAGFVMLALGIIGAFVPLMPTTIFLIRAAWCFARSSPRIENWLLTHPRFGPVLNAWRKEGAIPCRGKIMACTGMAVGFGLFLLGAHPSLELLLIVLVIILAGAWYVVSRPEPSLSHKPPQ